MSRKLNRQQSRRVDELAIRSYGMLGLVLMENAGRGCADLLEQLGIAGEVVVCCGKGNNGGDGFVIARHLEARGHAVRVLLMAAPDAFSGDALANLQILRAGRTPLEFWEPSQAAGWRGRIHSADWVVDALLGTGTQGAPRAPYDAVIRAINERTGRAMAIDLPSGLDCDTGIPSDPTVRADFTCTFVTAKTGFEASSAQQFLGKVTVLPIGVPARLLAEI